MGLQFAIIAALLIQGLITAYNRRIGAFAGVVITSVVLVWGLIIYLADFGVIEYFGFTLSLTIFLAIVVIWYGADAYEVYHAHKSREPEDYGSPDTDGLLEVQGLRKHFSVNTGVFSRSKARLKAVDGISMSIETGKTYGLVGESGCGKTTTAKMVLLLEDPTEGRLFFDGKNVSSLDREGMRVYKSSVQAVFQDPWASLNPRMRVGSIIGEPLEVNSVMTKGEIRTRVSGLLEEVGLQPYQSTLFPHEFSGGQRQRIGVARALALNPRLIVLDEPVSALDVSIRAQIMNLLEDLQDEHNLTYLLIAHHLATVRYMCDKVGVMYLGRLVEEAETEELFDNPQHPYTKALMSAALPSHPDIEREEIILTGEVPSPVTPPTGCHSHPRCPQRIDEDNLCAGTPPVLSETATGHKVVCHLYGDSSQ